jgi:phage terminase large subunit-like protein
VSHVGSNLKQLERQMTTWNPHSSKVSPGRIDALVHVIKWLLTSGRPAQTTSRFRSIIGLNEDQ